MAQLEYGPFPSWDTSNRNKAPFLLCLPSQYQLMRDYYWGDLGHHKILSRMTAIIRMIVIIRSEERHLIETIPKCTNLDKIKLMSFNILFI